MAVSGAENRFPMVSKVNPNPIKNILQINF